MNIPAQPKKILIQILLLEADLGQNSGVSDSSSKNRPNNEPVDEEIEMNGFVKQSGMAALCVSFLLVTGCASNARVDAVESTANNALTTAQSAQQAADAARTAANAAMQAAERAQATADQALRAANDANAAITRLTETLGSK